MKMQIKQNMGGDYTDLSLDKLIAYIGFFAPLFVATQEEVDYLLGLSFMIGRDIEVSLITDPMVKTSLPPSYIRIIWDEDMEA